ncbi:MAG TPA: hypothetical protein VMX18_04505 [Candidatus Bipolaricaulota bacterium]|nr:hypothetical protein [Candidatus Bipolaricaulota bacterium]
MKKKIIVKIYDSPGEKIKSLRRKTRKKSGVLHRPTKKIASKKTYNRRQTKLEVKKQLS